MTSLKPTADSDPQRLPRWFSFAVLIAYAVLAFGIFGPFLGNPFAMDDEIQITGNAHVHSLENFGQFFTSSTMGSGGAKQMGGIYYKPLLTTYYAVAWHFFPEQPEAFRIPLLCCHILSAFFIFSISRRFLSQTGAAITGLLFLMHPVNAEVVAYIADAQDILYMFFGLLSLWLMIRAKTKWGVIAATIPPLTLGILSKETGALFFFILPIYTFLFDRKKVFATLTASFIVGSIYSVARISVGFTKLAIPSLILHNAPWIERVQTVPLILWHYIEIFFVPYRISLATDFVNREFTFASFWAPMLGAIAFFALIAYMYRSLKNPVHKRIYHFFFAILGMWWALHGQVLIPLDGTYADRWFYLPSWCFIAMFLIAIEERVQWSRAGFAAIAVLVLAFSARTWVRLLDFEEPLKLYTWESTIHPWDAIMTNNVGVELFRRGRINESGPYFKKAVELNNNWDVSWSNYGAYAQRTNQIAEAKHAYEEALKRGTYSLAYENYAGILLTLGQRDECRKFLEERALPIFPNNNVLRSIASEVGARSGL